MNYAVFSCFYDDLMQEVPYEKVANRLSSLLTQYGVGRGLLLDLACGTGTVSLALSKKGYEVIGVDFSEDMLMQAQEKAQNAGENILFLCQDMCALDLYGTMDAAVCTLDSFNHLPNKEAVLQALQRVSLFLNPNGIFLFDVNTIYKHQAVLQNNTFIYETEEVFCSWQNTLLEDKKTVQMDLDFFLETEDGLYEREHEEITECAYALEEWKELLSLAGFTLLDVFDSYENQKSNEKTERYLIAARKKG